MAEAFAVSGKRRIPLVDNIELNDVPTEALLRSAPNEVYSVSDGTSAMTETARSGSVRPAAISAQNGLAARFRSSEADRAAHIARPIVPHDLLRRIESVFCQPSIALEPDFWQRQCYDDWASRLGTERVDGFLALLRDQLRALLDLLADDSRKNQALRLAHDVASTGGMFGFHEVTRCCRALPEACGTMTEAAARRALVDALERAAAHLDDHLARVDQTAVAA